MLTPLLSRVQLCDPMDGSLRNTALPWPLISMSVALSCAVGSHIFFR